MYKYYPDCKTAFETEVESKFEPVTNLKNAQRIEENEQNQESSKTENEAPFKPVTELIEEREETQKSSKTAFEANSENSQWIVGREDIQTGMQAPNPLSSDIDGQVKSMMEKSKNRVKLANRTGNVTNPYMCKVCGKEGDCSSIKYHVERSHLGNFVVLCDQCPKSYSTRIDLKRHKLIHS